MAAQKDIWINFAVRMHTVKHFFTWLGSIHLLEKVLSKTTFSAVDLAIYNFTMFSEVVANMLKRFRKETKYLIMLELRVG